MSEALAGITVLDLSAHSGQYCSKLFSDLGARVILIEPPEGSPVRRQSPLLEGHTGPESSLAFSYFNAGKESVCLDLETSEGQLALKRLVAQADVLIESERPGLMAARGLGYGDLSALNPRLVMTSITPFGQTGPYALFANDDIVSLALGGMLNLGGYHDSPPIAAAGNQAYLAAAQFAAVSSLMAVLGAEGGGAQAGRHIDVSIQECVVMGMENAVQFYDLEKVVRRRETGRERWAGTGVFDCLDGQVYVMAGGIVPARFRIATVQWLLDDGIEEARQMLDSIWDSQDHQSTAEARELFRELFASFAAGRTRDWLYHEGQARRIPICPINTPADLISNRQLNARGHFSELVLRDNGKKFIAPGAPYQMSATPWKRHGPAPMLGEHTAAVLAEASLKEATL